LSNLVKGLILVVIVLAIGAGLVVWKKKAGGGDENYSGISKHEIELLLADVATKNPAGLKRFAQDADMKQKQLESLKQLMAFAVEAQKEGLASDANNRQELQNIRSQIEASLYDKQINGQKGANMPPFSFITEDQVNQFWGEDKGSQSGPGYFTSFLDKIGLSGTAESRTHEAEFDKFLNSLIELRKQNDPEGKAPEVTDEDRKDARDVFAKIKIYQKEYEDKVKAKQLPQDFIDSVNLQVKLQQAQFLAGVYSKKVSEEIKASDKDIADYISQHPELDPKDKKAKAEEILQRAKNGEDFATLANENTEDPGNKNPKGEPQGGLYTNVQKGRMVKPFEDAALSLQPGQIYPDVVESDFGYHIIKLEKKTDTKDSSGNPSVSYDVRHILIATTYTDPNNPMGRPVPVKEYVRQKIESDREKKLIDDVVAKSGVTVAQDFDIPQVTDQQIQDAMKQQQQQMSSEEDENGPPPPPAKDDKKKDAKKTK